MRTLATKQSSKDSSQQQNGYSARRSHHFSPLTTGMPLLQRQCACGGGCPRCHEELGIQTKLKISEPGDKYEQEADRIADEVMRMPDPSVQRQIEPEEEEKTLQTNPLAEQITPLVQRQTEPMEEEEEEMLQTKAPSGQTPTVSSSLQDRITVLKGGGQPLPHSERAFFEPRFGTDFSQVRVHTDSQAAETAQALKARAFTVGQDIVFGARQYQLSGSEGKRLLAHELTHVIQQAKTSDIANSIQRTLASSSSCAANAHNAPADPLATLTTVDTLAQNMALGASNVLFVETLTFNDPTFGRSFVFDAYRRWFGTPQQTSSGTWQSRFRTRPFATEEEAITHELQELSNRFQRIHRWLARDIRYRCPGTRRYTIPGCRADICGTRAAQTCPTGSRTIGICPNFWLEPAPRDRAQAAVLIHEAIHPEFHFERHSTASISGRGRNPGCYQGFVLEIFNTGLQPGDCSAI